MRTKQQKLKFNYGKKFASVFHAKCIEKVKMILELNRFKNNETR